MAFKTQHECITALKDVQETEHDNREQVREADLFLNKRDGQWEPAIVQAFSGKPRYTFDECNPIVDEIMGSIEARDFNIRVSPAGDDASMDLARAYEGIIRHIENISTATKKVYNPAARIMVGTGFSAIRIITGFRDDNSFQQDLLLTHVKNAQDCLWFDPDTLEPDASDAEYCWNLFMLSDRKFKKEYPEASGRSVPVDRVDTSWWFKQPGQVVVGEYLYRKKFTRELALLSNGNVVEVDESFSRIRDELFAKNIKVERTRTRVYHKVYQRMFDGHDWIEDENATVFNHIPIIPMYGNFKISENKVIYYGVVEKLMDAQRVINYAESRKIEEGALAPKGKTWMSKDQAESQDVKETLATLNTNTDPVQFYDFAEGHPPPFYDGPKGPNQGLMETSASAQNYVQRTSGTYDEARGTAPPRRSGYAIERLQDKSDSPKSKWFSSIETAISHACTILITAIPKVYDTPQLMRLVNPDGTEDYVNIYQEVMDEQSGEMIKMYDLSVGKYSVVCTSGPAFQSKQQETVSAIVELGQVDPSLVQIGADILLRNINAPGIDKLAERKRRQMVLQGMIPQEQMTEEEKQLMESMSKQDDMTPTDRANLMIARAQEQDIQGKNEERLAKLELENQKLRLREMEIQLKGKAQQDKAMLDSIKALNEQIKLQAETLKAIREGLGVDQIISKSAVDAFTNQAKELNDSVQTQ
jgi:hypothetical protein